MNDAQNPGGWPDPSRPGVPLNPERDGWHWLHHPEDLRPMVQPWNAELGGWVSGALHSPQGVVDLGFRYLGPCLTNTEVEAREAAAAAKEREACALIAAERGAWASNDADAESLVDRLEARGRMDAASEIAAAIRARGKEVGGE